MDLRTALIDFNDKIGDKISCLRYILPPEYTTYLTTITAVLIGWLFVSWIFHLIWMLLGPLIISAIAIALMCPVTSKWCFQQMGTNLEGIISSLSSRINSSINDMNLPAETN